MKGLYRLLTIVAFCVCALMISASYGSAASPTNPTAANAATNRQNVEQAVTVDAAPVDLAQAMHDESAGISGGLMKYEFIRHEPSFEVVKTSEGFARPIDHVPN